MKVLLRFIFFSLGIVLIVSALIAPFTFLKPSSTDQQVSDELVQQKPPKKVKKEIEKPLHNVKLPNFAAIRDVKEKKKKFFAFLRPAIEKANAAILSNRQRILLLEEKLGLEEEISNSEIEFLNQLVEKYRVKNADTPMQQVNALLERVDVVPTSLVLVQAANESAWGTSRFAKIGLNFFGIWCYRKGCGLVPNSRDEDANHEVAAFKSIDSAVASYLYNINTHYSYDVFREIRSQLRLQDHPLTPEVLATGLIPYSERGDEYVVDIIDMLRHNKKYFAGDNI